MRKRYRQVLYFMLIIHVMDCVCYLEGICGVALRFMHVDS